MLNSEQLKEKKEELLKYLDTMRRSEKEVLNLFLIDKITEVDFYDRCKESQKKYMEFLEKLTCN